MIAFEDRGTQVVLTYESDQGIVSWIDEKLRTEGEASLSRTFTVRPADRLLFGDDDNEDARAFVIGEVKAEYRIIRKDVLGLKHDLRIARSIALSRAVFVAERNISIFRRIDELVDEPIVVGGSLPDAIPEQEFARLLRDFPTTTELNLYAWTRVTRVLREYLQTMSDAERRLSDYMLRRERSRVKSRDGAHGRIHVASELDLEKFTYVRDRLAEMLADVEGYSEVEWQSSVADLFLLIFPQYVAVLHHVKVKEWYSKAPRPTVREIDLMLIGSNGCVDILEIKRPFERSLVSKSKYRDNHVPVRELSGSLMQAEKYLFYLSKSGRDGEMGIAAKYAAKLPAGLEVRIANPKAIILSGRDDGLTAKEKFDFEFARRAYSNVVDIISYDDLLRRIDNIVASLATRSAGGGAPATGAKLGAPL